MNRPSQVYGTVYLSSGYSVSTCKHVGAAAINVYCQEMGTCFLHNLHESPPGQRVRILASSFERGIGAQGCTSKPSCPTSRVLSSEVPDVSYPLEAADRCSVGAACRGLHAPLTYLLASPTCLPAYLPFLNACFRRSTSAHLPLPACLPIYLALQSAATA